MIGAGDQEGEAQKRELEMQKLSLEQRLLTRQLSLQGLLIEWLKAAAVPVTLLGAITAFFIGFGQLRQNAENQTAERFDKSLTRLASERADERMTGVSGLQLFLHARDTSLQEQTLQFLINALSLERDSRVQGAILDVVAGIAPGAIQQATLNGTLETAVKRDRSLTKIITGAWRDRIAAEKWKRLAAFGIPGLNAKQAGTKIPAAVISKLTVKQYLNLLDANHGPFKSLETVEMVPLQGLALAITTLVALGASASDFRDIYCEGCDFSTAKSLDGAAFDGSFLAFADFSHISLRKSSFLDADLGGINFFAADLSRADLRVTGPPKPMASHGLSGVFPLLECAVLAGADLSGLPLAVFERNFNTFEGRHAYDIIVPKMMSIKIDAATKLDKFSIIAVSFITDAYLKSNPHDPALERLIKYREIPWRNPLLDHGGGGVDLFRLQGDYAEDPENYTETAAYMRSEIDESELSHLTQEASLLRGHLNQPRLQAIPFFAKFTAALAALNLPDDIAKRAGNAWSAKAEQAWKAEAPPTCAEHPSFDSLIFNLGMWPPESTPPTKAVPGVSSKK